MRSWCGKGGGRSRCGKGGGRGCSMTGKGSGLGVKCGHMCCSGDGQ